jgi:hypothetical protein
LAGESPPPHAGWLFPSPGSPVAATTRKPGRRPPSSPYQPGIHPARLPAIHPATCAPVYWSAQGASGYAATARIDTFAHTTNTPEQSGSIVLTVYGAADAPKVMAGLRNALPACVNAHSERHGLLADGISFTHPEVQPAPRLGDDALTFRITQNVAGDDIGPEPIDVPMTFTVVRVGTTIATFWNLSGRDRTQPAVIAPQLIPAQLARLTGKHRSTV